MAAELDAEVFVPWIPRRPSAFDGKHWVPTGERAWFTTTVKVTTFWGETYYVSHQHFFSSAPFIPKTTEPQPRPGSEGQGET